MDIDNPEKMNRAVRRAQAGTCAALVAGMLFAVYTNLGRASFGVAGIALTATSATFFVMLMNLVRAQVRKGLTGGVPRKGLLPALIPTLMAFGLNLGTGYTLCGTFLTALHEGISLFTPIGPLVASVSTGLWIRVLMDDLRKLFGPATTAENECGAATR